MTPEPHIDERISATDASKAVLSSEQNPSLPIRQNSCPLFLYIRRREPSESRSSAANNGAFFFFEGTGAGFRARFDFLFSG